MGIKRDTLKFVEEAKEHFEKDGKYEGATYHNKDYIALRWGIFDDCLKVYELGEEVGFFEQWLDRVTNNEMIDYFIRKLEREIYMDYTEEQISRLEKLIAHIKDKNNWS
jgi:hypothetical protein